MVPWCGTWVWWYRGVVVPGTWVVGMGTWYWVQGMGTGHGVVPVRVLALVSPGLDVLAVVSPGLDVLTVVS